MLIYSVLWLWLFYLLELLLGYKALIMSVRILLGGHSFVSSTRYKLNFKTKIMKKSNDNKINFYVTRFVNRENKIIISDNTDI